MPIFLGILGLCVVFTSCGGSKKDSSTETTLVFELKQKTIAGELGDYFEIAKHEIVDANGSFPKLVVTLKRNDVELPYISEYIDSYGVSSDQVYIKIGLGIELYEDSDIPIYIYKGTTYSDNEIQPLMKLNAGEFGTKTWYLSDVDLKNCKSIKLTSSVEVVDKRGLKTTKSTNNKSNNWDSVLDEYEKFVDQYIKLYKKAQSGDMSALTEYVSMLEKAESLQNKLENSKSDLTPAQVTRLNKIISKMTQAL